MDKDAADREKFEVLVVALGAGLERRLELELGLRMDAKMPERALPVAAKAEPEPEFFRSLVSVALLPGRSFFPNRSPLLTRLMDLRAAAGRWRVEEDAGSCCRLAGGGGGATE